MNKLGFLLCLLIIFWGASCKNRSERTGVLNFPGADPDAVETVNLSIEEIEEISRSITSPVEIANLLISRKIPFSSNYIDPLVDPSNRITEFDKAIGLGILGADLGYLNMYEKTAINSGVLESIGKLAEDLGVGHFFDREKIRKFSADKSNFDSLLIISLESFTGIDKYMREDNRDHLSALMVIGAWIEGQYLATRVAKGSDDKVLRDRIGEQKIILSDLVLLASAYCSRSDEFGQLCNDLKEINEIYSDIRITYTSDDPDSSIIDGALVITQTEKSEVEMSDEQLAEIIEITGNIRNKLVLNN